MLLAFTLPAFVPQMTEAKVLRRLAAPGDGVHTGSALLELEVDLTGVVAADCPAVSYYRLILREPGIVRDLPATGEVVPVGERLALVAQSPEDAAEGEAGRRLRLNIAAVFPRWDEMV